MTTFEELSALRRNYVDSARANGFEEGLRNLLSELYPDNAHFIYELLQNAEDAGAHEVIFELRSDGLRVEHDGERLFDLGDIDSITGIGKSTKKDDATTIGKFGVGFKAVFAYTETPVVHSGVHSFSIQDLFVPTLVDAVGGSARTTFWFPFNRAGKPTHQAVKEVAGALRDLSPTTLLFLNNIRLISCSLPDGGEVLLERVPLDEHMIKIESVHDEAASYWYRVTGDVDIDGKPHPAAAAFALDAPGEQPKGPKRYTVRPVNGQVFIYFPAVKETSGLRFHIHAPFASTVARDSVRDDPGNDELIAGISELIAEALPAMRDAGLITDELLNALPNEDDDLPERYDVVRDRIVEAFENGELTPMFGGGHAPSVQLFRAENSSLRGALDIDDANFLQRFAEDDPDPRLGWIRSAEGRARTFLNALSADDFTIPHLLGLAPDETTDADAYQEWDAWLAGKPDDWLRRFYAALGGLAPRYSIVPWMSSAWRSAPFIRVQDGEATTHVAGPFAYRPTAAGLRGDGLVIDALAVFDDEADAGVGGDARERSAVRDFYRVAGVRPWDAAAQLDARLNAYADQPPAVTEQHLADLKALNDLIDRRMVSPSSYSKRQIFATVDADGDPVDDWMSADHLYLDSPFRTTGLAALYESPEFPGPHRWALDPAYADASFDVAALAAKLGATDSLSISRAELTFNPQAYRLVHLRGRVNHNAVSDDWTITHFDLIVDTEDEVLLRTLFTLVATAPERYADAVYRPNASMPLHRIDSRLLQKLRTSAWVLDRDGALRRPEDISAAELADGLQVPANAKLLERAGFGHKAAATAQQREEVERIVKALGFGSADVAKEFAEILRDRTEEEQRQALAQWRELLATSLPEASSGAPEQRAQRARDQAADAPTRRYDQRVRSVYISEPGHRSLARGYLTQFYTNDDGIMSCQVCHQEMPFKVSGEYYFEAVQFVKDTKHDLRANRLALCPTCAAKYRHAPDTPPEKLRYDLLTQQVGQQGHITVEVVLAGAPATIRFVGKHAIDLQSALEATESTQIEDDEPEGPFG